MKQDITIRNLENHEVFHFNESVWGLSYNQETAIFSCDDFRMDMWLKNECREPLKLASSLFPEMDEGYTFQTYKDALTFYGWLQTQAHPAYLRMCHAP